MWCPSGRWGPRRTRVTECHAVLTAEDTYTAVLRGDATVKAGSCGKVSWTLGGEAFIADWELRPNAVWRRGRLFLTCPRCEARCTRLYVPLPSSWLGWPPVLGPYVQLPTLLNYKDSPWGRGVFASVFGTSQRDWARLTTQEKRQDQRLRSTRRWAERRPG